VQENDIIIDIVADTPYGCLKQMEHQDMQWKQALELGEGAFKQVSSKVDIKEEKSGKQACVPDKVAQSIRTYSKLDPNSLAWGISAYFRRQQHVIREALQSARLSSPSSRKETRNGNGKSSSARAWSFFHRTEKAAHISKSNGVALAQVDSAQTPEEDAASVFAPMLPDAVISEDIKRWVQMRNVAKVLGSMQKASDLYEFVGFWPKGEPKGLHSKAGYKDGLSWTRRHGMSGPDKNSTDRPNDSAMTKRLRWLEEKDILESARSMSELPKKAIQALALILNPNVPVPEALAAEIFQWFAEKHLKKMHVAGCTGRALGFRLLNAPPALTASGIATVSLFGDKAVDVNRLVQLAG